MESNEGMGHTKAMQLADRAHSAFALRIAIYILLYSLHYSREIGLMGIREIFRSREAFFLVVVSFMGTK